MYRIFKKLSLGSLAPAGNFPNPRTVFNTLLENRQIGKAGVREKLSQSLKASFGSQDVLILGSGKEALKLGCELLRRDAVEGNTRDIIAISAYTCPDVVSAVLAAGCKVLPLDVNPITLDIDYSTVPPECEGKIRAVVLSNLYGLPDAAAVSPWPVIDDACQAFLSKDGGVKIGCRGEFGVVSFGRGKALCAIGGGALSISAQELKCPRKEQFGFSSVAVPFGEAASFFKYLASWLFEHPPVFGCVKNIPYLHIGKTEVVSSVTSAEMTEFSLLVALAQFARRDSIAETYQAHAKLWSELLSNTDLVQPYITRKFANFAEVVPIRYPIICATIAQREKLFEKLDREGLGVSISYPKAIHEYGEFKNQNLIKVSCPNAELIAKKILTLPTHVYVTKKEMYRTYQLIKKEAQNG